MKISTKSVFTLFFLCVAFASSAQIYRAKAGINLSSMLFRDAGGSPLQEPKILPGVHFGGTAEFPIKDNISFETGLLFSTKGVKSEWLTLSTLNIDIPLTGRITHEWNSRTFYGIFGPYLGLGLFGQKKYPESSTKVEWGSGINDNLKRVDIGLSFGAGIVLNPIEIGLQYNLGLSNLTPFTWEKVANRVFAITAAYKLER